MKKYRFKNYLLCGIFLIGICVAMNSCQKDVIIDGPQNQIKRKLPKNLKSTIISIDSVLNENKSIKRQLLKIGMNLNSKNRTLTSNLGFSIDTSLVLKIETDSYNSYSFQTERDTETPNNLENYIITYYNTGNYVQHLINYPILEDGIYDFDNAQIEIIHDESLIFMRESCVMVAEFEESVCTEHVCGDPQGAAHTFAQGDACLYWGTSLSATKNCTQAGWVENEFCSGGSDNGSGPGNGGGTGGNSNDDDDDDDDDEPIVIIPTDNNIIKHKSNCNALNKLSQSDEHSANINPLVQELRTRINEEKEYSVNFKKNINFGEEYSFPNDEGIIEGDSKTVSTIHWGIQQFGAIHTHPVGTIHMFSWKDVDRLRLVYNNLHDNFTKEDVFVMIVNGDGTVYAIKVNDINALNTILDEELENVKGKTIEIKENKLNERLSKKYRKSDDDETVFLEKFQNYGVSLYKADDENLSNWSRLDFDNITLNNPNVISIPCN
ncbi:hypothetical protein WNY78_18155 [Psychroserpens sp. AS72]|uniref:hypothetical protein n=1 Tax=Psychroserpens sp. AS72 TaxID=3135775 RepID=UPI00317BC994